MKEPDAEATSGSDMPSGSVPVDEAENLGLDPAEVPAPVQKALIGLCREVIAVASADSAGVALSNGQHLRFVAGHGFPWQQVPAVPLGQSMIGAVAARGSIIESPDLTEDPKCTTSDHARRMGVAAFLGCPLKDDDHSVIGVLAAHRRTPGRWTAEQILLVEAMARTASVFLRSLGSALAMTVEACPPVATNIICESPTTRDAFRRAELIATTPYAVMILGETGTGKEVLGRHIHFLSRRSGRFVAVNCPAVSESLFESEFFGHSKGAFTGAFRAREGLFIEANGGTLFLDELGDLRPELQAKLLRAAQAKEVRRLGETAPTPTDVRLICATHRTISRGLEPGFREDLFYRLSEYEIRLAPLRERPEDLQTLARVFLKEIAAEMNRPPGRISGAAMDVLRRHSWPGNVRELKRVLLSAIVETPIGDPISAETIRQELRRLGTTPYSGTHLSLSPVDPLLVSLWDRHQGNISAMARDLGTSRQNLQQKLKRAGLRAGSC